MDRITLGYGDIVPATPLEQICVCIIGIIATVIFGYCLNTSNFLQIL